MCSEVAIIWLPCSLMLLHLLQSNLGVSEAQFVDNLEINFNTIFELNIILGSWLILRTTVLRLILRQNLTMHFTCLKAIDSFKK